MELHSIMDSMSSLRRYFFMKKKLLCMLALLPLSAVALFAADPVEGFRKGVDEQGVATALLW